MILEISSRRTWRAFTIVLKWLRFPVGLMLFGYILSPQFWSFWRATHPNGQLILDYFSVLKWPVIVLVIFFMTRRFIPEVLESLEEITAGKFGAKFHKKEEQDSEKLSVTTEGKEPAQDPVGNSDQDSIDSILTSSEANESFENVLSAIYGTQILVLKRLLERVPEGLAEHQLYDIYKAHKRADPNPYPSLIHLLQFLLDNSLILFDPETKLYQLTNAGLYFLRYLSRTNRYASLPQN